MTDVRTAAIRRGTKADLSQVRDLLACAFHDGDLAPWLAPDPQERARIYPGYFAIFAEHALTHGLVELIDGTAVALWYALGADPHIPVLHYDRRLADAVGPTRVHRFRQLDEAMQVHHPSGRPHDYLAFLAVHPDWQGRGLGSRLLSNHHRRLDRIGAPAYLEATGPSNERLYARHGYRLRGRYRPAADSPPLRPMWRDARPPRT